jgi:chaperonin cofactor prefoldin
MNIEGKNEGKEGRMNVDEKNIERFLKGSIEELEERAERLRNSLKVSEKHEEMKNAEEFRYLLGEIKEKIKDKK